MSVREEEKTKGTNQFIYEVDRGASFFSDSDRFYNFECIWMQKCNAARAVAVQQMHTVECQTPSFCSWTWEDSTFQRQFDQQNTQNLSSTGNNVPVEQQRGRIIYQKLTILPSSEREKESNI